MKRILFVDDEPKVLAGLQRMLRPQRKEWDMVFVHSGAEAVALLAASRFDVIVSDVRMPEIDGVQLLEHAQREFPGMVRIVLSGYFEREAALEAAGIAHQYLAKPCDPDKLKEAVERSCGLTAILPDEGMRRAVGAIGALPALPRTCALLLEALQEPEVRLDEIARIVEQDVGMTAKVLQLVNSPLFGLLCEITTARRAVGFIGLDVLRQLVLSLEVFRAFQPERRIPGFSIEALQEHSCLAAKIAARLPAPEAVVSAAVVAALLHDVGKLVMASRLPGEFEQVLRTSLNQGRPLFVVEEELIGTSHAQIGSYLLGLWGLPESIVEAVRQHHHPTLAKPAGQGLDVLAITHVADALATELSTEVPPEYPSPPRVPLDLDYLTALGAAAEVPSWRTMAGEIANPAGVLIGREQLSLRAGQLQRE